MSSRVITVSLVLNVVLLGLVGWLFSNLKKEERVAAAKPEAETVYVTNTVKQIAVRKVGSSNFWAMLAEAQKPSWHLLESTNYFEYIENLKAIGCPEETIQDIIIADVAKNYSKRRAELLAKAPPVPYWRPEREWKKSPQSVALDQQLTALVQEEKELVKQLLGVDLPAELTKFDRESQSRNTELSFLPEEKRKKVRDLDKQFEQSVEAVYNEANGIVLPADEERVRKLKKQRDEDLAKILTPEEMQDYQLRASPTAVMLREQMANFDGTEEEFRKVFALQKVFDDQFGDGFDLTDTQQMETRMRAEEDARKALEEAVKKELGEKRFAEYQRSQDGDYTTLVSATERFGGTRDMAAKVYDMKQVAEKQREALEANTRLTPEQRQAGMDAMVKEVQRQVMQTLGGENSSLWNAYKQTGAYWIEGLNTPQVIPEIDVPEGDGMVAPNPNTPPMPPMPPTIPLPYPGPVRQ